MRLLRAMLPRILPARAASPPAQEPGTSTSNALAACLSCVRGLTRTHESYGAGALERASATRPATQPTHHAGVQLDAGRAIQRLVRDADAGAGRRAGR